MGTVPRPDVKIKVYPEYLVHDHKLQILKKLKTTDALILNLTEDIKGNVLKKPFPFITFQRISSSEQLPRDLKLDGDPWSDYFITLKSFKKEVASTSKPSSSGSGHKSGFIILAFKVTDDDRTELYDQGWTEWSGATTLTGMLSKKYEVIRVACYKGVNECPDVFKYIILIEFIIVDGCDTHARDCMQRFRICRMSGYAALYQDFPSKDIEQAIEEEQSLNDMIESLDLWERPQQLTFAQIEASTNQQSPVQGQIKKRSVPEEPIGEMDDSTSSHSKIINIMKYV